MQAGQLIQSYFMKKIFIVCFALFVTIFDAVGQDGKIISQQPYLFADSTVKQLEVVIPDARKIISSVDFYKIKYLSDGLKVTGYIAVPKTAGKFPCVIFNRGGNRELSALNPNSILRFLGQVASWGYV